MRNKSGGIRLVAFDLDGTTLSGHAGLSARNLRAMEAAHAAGVWLVPATGRVKNFLPECLRALPFLRYAITSNGGAVWDLQNGTAVCRRLISAETALSVQKILSDYPLFVEYYVNGTAVVERGGPERAKTVYGIPPEKYYFLTKNYQFVDDMEAYIMETKTEVEKVNIMFIPEAVRAELLSRIRAVDGLALTFSNVDNVELNAAGCDKGTGLQALCAALGLDLSETLAVGDNGNDLGMLRAAGIAAVVENGIPEAKDAADVLVASCKDNGFAEAVERFILNR